MSLDYPNDFEIRSVDMNNIYRIVFSIQLTLAERSFLQTSFPPVTAKLVRDFVEEGIKQNLYPIFKEVFARCGEDLDRVQVYAANVLEELAINHWLDRVSIDGNSDGIKINYSLKPTVLGDYFLEIERQNLSKN